MAENTLLKWNILVLLHIFIVFFFSNHKNKYNCLSVVLFVLCALDSVYIHVETVCS